MPALHVDDLKGKRIERPRLRGLDELPPAHRDPLAALPGVEPHVYTVDLGQPDEPDLEAVRQRMLACGAVSATVLPGQEALAEAGLKVIQAQAQYEGGYWNTTAIARYVTTRLAVAALRQDGIDVLFHGATGRGNDQVRFQLATNMLAPQMAGLRPWRDPAMLDTFGGRKEMVEYAAAYGPADQGQRGEDLLHGRQHAGADPRGGPAGGAGDPGHAGHPGDGGLALGRPGDHAFVSLTWEGGRPVAVDGVATPWWRSFRQANALAGAHGVGIGRHVVENRFVGIKSRGVYEAPGMELLGQAYEYLLQLYLDRRARELFDHLSRYLATQIYQGYWYDLGTTAALAAVERMAGIVSGTVTLRLYRGTSSSRGPATWRGRGRCTRGRRFDGARGVVRPRRRRGLPARPGRARAQLRPPCCPA